MPTVLLVNKDGINGDDIVKVICAQPACARFIATHAGPCHGHEAGRLVGFLRSPRLVALLAQAVADRGDILRRRSVRPRRQRPGNAQRENERQQQTAKLHAP